MQPFCRQYMGAHLRDQWRQGGGTGAHPIGQRRGVEIDPLAGKGLALAAQRQVIGKFAGQDHRQQPWPGATPSDRMERCRRLGDAFAVPAGEFLPHRLDHLEPARDHLQGLGHALAQLRQTE